MNEEKNQTPILEEQELPTPEQTTESIEPEQKVAFAEPELSALPPAPEAEKESAAPAEGEPTEEESPAAPTEEEPEATTEPAAPTVIYRWDYSEQKRHDEDIRRKKEGKRSGLAFAGIVSCAFLLVIGLLIGVLAFRDHLIPKYLVANTVEIAEDLLPSTVLITATKGSSGNTGSGFFVRQDGYIVTNFHVVDGMTTIKIKMYNSNEKKEATLVGYNSECDIAVLKVAGSGYPAVTFGDSSALHVGETAIAVGCPEGSEAEWSVTQGIISSVDRKILATTETEIIELHMIQTDAAVNPGNSGCLLCNGNGEVIGIVARKQVYRTLITDTNEAVAIFDEGIGYVIPGNGAKAVIESIIQMQSVDTVSVGLMRRRPRIGISVVSIKQGETLSELQEISAPADGVLVSAVSEKGANGYLSVGDIIVKFDGVRVTENDQLIEMLYSYKRGDKVKLVIYKNGDFFESEVELTLGVFE